MIDSRLNGLLVDDKDGIIQLISDFDTEIFLVETGRVTDRNKKVQSKDER